MKIELVTISEPYSKTSYYSGTVELHTSDKIDENLSEETIEDIEVTIIHTAYENLEDSIDVTIISDLPEGIDEEQFKAEVIKQYQSKF